MECWFSDTKFEKKTEKKIFYFAASFSYDMLGKSRRRHPPRGAKRGRPRGSRRGGGTGSLGRSDTTSKTPTGGKCCFFFFLNSNKCVHVRSDNFNVVKQISVILITIPFRSSQINANPL